MAVSLHHVVIDAYDLPGLARFWGGVLDWRVLSEKPREVVIGAGEFAETGICFMPVSDPKTVKNRLHFDLAPTIRRPRSSGSSRWARGGSTSDRARPWAEWCSPTPRGTSSAYYDPRPRSSPFVTRRLIEPLVEPT